MGFKKLTLLLLTVAAATAHSQTPPMLDGHYNVELKIQDRIFRDKLELAGLNEALHPHHFGGAVTGTMEVPGVFKVPLQGTGHCTLWGGFCTFEFKITADENGQQYQVTYKMEMRGAAYNNAINGQQTVFTGEAFLNNGQLLGPFTAVKQNE